MENTPNNSLQANENIRQCFYIVSQSEKSEHLYNNISTIYDLDIPVIVVVDPRDKTHKNVIESLEKLQEDKQIKILINRTEDLSKTYFMVKQYDKRLNISGEYQELGDKIIYSGDREVVFNYMDIDSPINTLSQTNIKKGTKENIGIIVSKDNLNISTLLLAFNELEGQKLETGTYELKIEDQGKAYKVINSIGHMTLILFVISIMIFLVAIVIFRKWSEERFLD